MDFPFVSSSLTKIYQCNSSIGLIFMIEKSFCLLCPIRNVFLCLFFFFIYLFLIFFVDVYYDHFRSTPWMNELHRNVGLKSPSTVLMRRQSSTSTFCLQRRLGNMRRRMLLLTLLVLLLLLKLYACVCDQIKTLLDPADTTHIYKKWIDYYASQDFEVSRHQKLRFFPYVEQKPFLFLFLHYAIRHQFGKLKSCWIN